MSTLIDTARKPLALKDVAMARDTHIDRNVADVKRADFALSRSDQVYLFAVAKVLPRLCAKLQAEEVNDPGEARELWMQNPAAVSKPMK